MKRTFGDLIEDNNAIFAFLAPAAETCAPRCVLAATVGAACTSRVGAGRLKTAPYHMAQFPASRRWLPSDAVSGLSSIPMEQGLRRPILRRWTRLGGAGRGGRP
jgi:hypothetical protein